MSRDSTYVLENSTMKVFRQGQPGDYAGSRKADGIISYMKKCVSRVHLL